jgi:hypothetical protein
VSRMTSIRKESRKSARRSTKMLAPAASDVRDSALRAAETTRDWAAPRVEAARDWAAPRVEPVTTRVREDVLPKVAGAVGAALVASEPVREEAKSRGTAAIAALKGEIEAPKPKKHRIRKFFLFATLVGAGVAAWKAWVGQQNRQPEPWATPIGSAPSGGTTYGSGSSGSSGSGGTSSISTTPTSAAATTGTDAAGASPDEALADAATDSDATADVPTTVAPKSEKVPAKAAKKAKAAETSRTDTSSTS